MIFECQDSGSVGRGSGGGGSSSMTRVTTGGVLESGVITSTTALAVFSGALMLVEGLVAVAATIDLL